MFGKNRKKAEQDLAGMFAFIANMSDEEIQELTNKSIASLHDKGMIDVTGITEDGEFIYDVTEHGRKYMETNSYAKQIAQIMDSLIEKMDDEDDTKNT